MQPLNQEDTFFSQGETIPWKIYNVLLYFPFESLMGFWPSEYVLKTQHIQDKILSL